MALGAGSCKKKCLVCKIHFLVAPSQVNLGRGKYCSKKCYGAASRKHKQVKCEQCGNQFYPRINKDKISKFCSHVCYRDFGKQSHVNVFWRNIRNHSDKNSCWIYSCCNPSGYGTIFVDGKKKLAHRYSYELHYGAITNDLHCLHKCDTPSCVNPNHLFLGTHQDNMADMKKKKRAPGRRGSKSPNSILTERKVKKIKLDLNAGARGSILSKKYKVSESAICAIKKGRTWQHV